MDGWDARSISPAPPRRRARARSFTMWGSMPIAGAALSRFVALPPSPLEQREKLEQLRALEANMSIAVARVDSVPLSVDTQADLEKANQFLHEIIP